MANFPKIEGEKKELLRYRLIRTTKRLVFEIQDQCPEITFTGKDDDNYFSFLASNNFMIISRSRMDVQTERLWLKGGTSDDIAFRSGTMVFDSNEKRDRVYNGFLKAIDEWANYCNGYVTKVIGED